MRIIDTHAHIYLEDFSTDLETVIERATEIGVEKVFLPNIDEDSLTDLISLYQRFPNLMFPMIGLHPCYVKENYEEQIENIFQRFSEVPFIAVGEIGIDLYWDQSLKIQQIEAFKLQVKKAIDFKLPIVIHSREATDLVLDCLEEWNFEGLRGIFHCFTGTAEQGRRIIALGLYLGIGGVVTFKNGGLDRVIPEIGLEKLVLETDAPYLSPVPFRGKRNEPAFLKYVVEKLSIILDCPEEEVKKVTCRNAEDFFQKPY